MAEEPTSSPPPSVFASPIHSFPRTFSYDFEFENGGTESMRKDALKQVENIVYERYILELKGKRFEMKVGENEGQIRWLRLFRLTDCFP